VQQKKHPVKNVSSKKALQRDSIKTLPKRSLSWLKARRWWQKLLLSLLAVVIAFFGTLYISAIVYRHKHRNEPVTYGVTFINNYAQYLGLDGHQTLLALRDDLGFRRFRLVSYWNDIEKTPGNYDFSELDWQFDQVEKVNGQVTLAIGLRQPRWPECHIPTWAEGESVDQLYPQLERYMTAVVKRYKDRPALQSYQLENEYFLKVFGKCPDFSRDRLKSEFSLVKKIDPDTPVILSLANNYFGVPTGQPRPDQFGVSVYKRVFDSNITNNYFEYPFPSWYYTGRAGLTELLTGRDSMLHELQAEPWPPGPIIDASVDEQNKSMDAKRLQERLRYGEQTGFKQIDLWGGEWWYWRKVKFNDPSLWNVVKTEIKNKN